MKLNKPISQEHALQMLAALKLSIQYLNHPEVKQIPFARGSESVANRIREIIEEIEKSA